MNALKEQLEKEYGRDFHFSYLRKLVGKVRNEINYEIDTAKIEPRLAELRENYRVMRDALLKIVYWTPEDHQDGMPRPLARDRVEACRAAAPGAMQVARSATRPATAGMVASGARIKPGKPGEALYREARAARCRPRAAVPLDMRCPSTCPAAAPGPMPVARSAARPLDAGAVANGSPARRSTASRPMPATGRSPRLAPPLRRDGCRWCDRPRGPRLPARWRAAPASSPASPARRSTASRSMPATCRAPRRAPARAGTDAGGAIGREALDCRHDGERRRDQARPGAPPRGARCR